MKHLIFFLLIIALKANCQSVEVDKTIKIGWDDQLSLYSNYVNCFAITASRDPMSTLVFKSTQGKLENRDSGIVNGHFKFSGLKNGSVTVSVFRKDGNRLAFLNYKEFNVVPKPMWDYVSKTQNEPEIDIEGYGSYHDDCKALTVPLHILKEAKKFNINGPYQITHIVILITDPKAIFDGTWVWELRSNYFDDEVLRVFSRLTAGFDITLDDIKIKDSKGKEYSLSLRGLKITDD